MMQERFPGIERAFSGARATFADMDRLYFGNNRSLWIGLSALLVTILLGAWWTVRKNASVDTYGTYFPGKANLALRRTAHYLLSEKGDSTSAIAPVQKIDADTWEITVDHAFNYDRLPVLLQQSLEVHGIRSDYDVAVLKCSDEVLQLGYNFLDFKQNSIVPCGGRDIEENCYKLRVHFNRAKTTSAGNGWLIWLVAIGGLLTGFFITARFRRKPAPDTFTETASAEPSMRVGQSTFDPDNQILISGKQRHKLTYREAKLLQLFAANPNRLLERDFILQSVWADEGILVGRSVDVFVSRLRKLLREDTTVRIVAVHGVGYRLEVG